jgi:DNA-binding NarL/FixJ family response regulator
MGGRGSGRKPLTGFSNRELELIALVLKGMQNKAIADQLLLSRATVRNQLNTASLRNLDARISLNW